MTITLPLPPSANRYWRYTRGRVLVSREARAYRARCQTAALAQRVQMLDGDVEVSGTVYFENRRRDLDGAIKVLFDALEGIAYRNDRQVASIALERAIDRDRPRVEIRVTPHTTHTEGS